MERIENRTAPEASTDERASAPDPEPGDALAFDPAPLRYRADGWTPDRQREFVETLADCGVIRHAAARVGMSEHSVSRLRRRAEARAFDLACEAAQRIGARRLHSIAYERAVEGTIRRHYYHGELKSEERVHDNRLLMFLIGKLGPALAPRPESLKVERDWDAWMEAIVRGELPPEPELPGSEAVWTGDDGELWTDFPPPAGFAGKEEGVCDGRDFYERTLTPAELATLREDDAAELAALCAARDRYFGFAGGVFSPSLQAEPSGPSEPSAAPPVDVHVKPGLSPAEHGRPAETAMSPISTKKHGDVLVVTSNNPPVNALGHAVREGLVKAIEEADGDESVNAVVILCQGQTFFAGADISEFGTPKSFEYPALPQVVDIIENCTKPVVAAIHGTAFGGGLEVALASHYRVAVPSAKLGVPEVKLGLLPGAGGTQRLPRAAGVGKALEMAATGNPVSAKEACDIGLVDRLIEGDLEQHAVAFAEEVRDVRPIPKTSERDD